MQHSSIATNYSQLHERIKQGPSYTPVGTEIQRMYLDPHFHLISGYLLNYHNVEKKVLYIRKIVILAKIPQNFIKE